MANEASANVAPVNQAAPQAPAEATAAPSSETQAAPVEQTGGNENATVNQTNTEQTNNVESQQKTFTEPTNLSEALEQVYSMESAGTKESVQEGETTQQPEQSQQPQQQETKQEPRQQIDTSKQLETTKQSDNRSGRSTDRQPQFNQRAYAENVNKTIIETSRREAAKELSDAGVKLYTFADVVERDENTGRTEFKNPDDGSVFRNRTEAQQWIDTQNKQVKETANNLTLQKAAQYRRTVRPAMEAQIFLNTRYQQMDTTTQNVFNELIEPYAINNNQGQRIGFNCDLNAMANKATTIVNNYFPKQQQQQAKAQEQPVAKAQPSKVSQPDLNMQTSGEPDKPEYPEPTNLEEALKIYNDIDDKRRTNGK